MYLWEVRMEEKEERKGGKEGKGGKTDLEIM